MQMIWISPNLMEIKIKLILLKYNDPNQELGLKTFHQHSAG